MHCLRHEFARSNPNPSEELDDDSSTGKRDYNHGSAGDCFNGEDERDDTSTDHGSPCRYFTGSDSTGHSATGYSPTGYSPTGYGSTGYGSAGYGSTGYGATDDDNESRRRRGWCRFLAVLTSDRRRKRPVLSSHTKAPLHMRRRPEWRKMGT